MTDGHTFNLSLLFYIYIYKYIFQYTEIKKKEIGNTFMLVIGNKKLRLNGEVNSGLFFNKNFSY